ncbi:Alpha-L-fucosidase [Clostridiaceae bacterium JG1575]|nr:Alpha-L-fucosidase [Clostridiaceae bacterium JG1575]
MTSPLPPWFSEHSLGLFIHFGLYSLLGGVYQGKPTPGLAEWIQLDLGIPEEEYQALAEEFNPTAFDADALVRFAKESGMGYLCFTAKHHDGFALFSSNVNGYNSQTASPCHRDFVRELSLACQKEHLPFCLYYSQAQDWHHPDGYRAYRDNSHRSFPCYFKECALPDVAQLLSDYGPIAMMWFDTPMGMSYEESLTLKKLVKSLQPHCLINGRIGHQLGDYLTLQDNRLPKNRIPIPWEVPATLNHSWGFHALDEGWRPFEEVLQNLVKIVSRGGHYLLNIGPDGRGAVLLKSLETLTALGHWLQLHKESLTGLAPLEDYVYETPGLYFTGKEHTLYLHLFSPERYAGKTLPLPNIANHIKSAQLLCTQAPVQITVGHVLEGDPYWGVPIPEVLPKEAGPDLVIRVALKEEAFRVSPLV